MTSRRQQPETRLDRLASIDLNLLVPLMALLEEVSVTRAAARVGLSQPAMSHALARMRRVLDDELLVRQGATMTLTPRAASLVAPLRQVLADAARFVDLPGFDPATDRRTITLALTPSTAYVLGGPLSRLVAQRAPGARLRLRTFAVPQSADFTEAAVDVVLVSEGLPAPFARERLYDDRWVVVSRRGAAPADASASDLLSTLPHVAFETSGRLSAPYAALDEAGTEHEIRTVVTEYLMVPTLVAEVGGVGFHRHRVATAMAGHLPLRIDEVPFAMPGLGMDVVWNPRLTDEAYVGWLRQVLHDAARS